MRITLVFLSIFLFPHALIAGEHRPWNTAVLGEFKHLERNAYTVDYAPKLRAPYLVS